MTNYSISEGRCPRCDSPDPHRHPAVQFEGEVEVCTHDFHLAPTPQNKPSYIAAVLAKRAAGDASSRQNTEA